jgi:DIS3-like exonuclease 2
MYFRGVRVLSSSDLHIFYFRNLQKVIDKCGELANVETFPRVHDGYTMQDCAKAIWELHTLAMKMRRRRFSQGALRIDQPKVVFQLDESKQPTSYTLYEGKECNW